jgi:hypothetical protein
MSPDPVPVEEKRKALERVLGSRVFGRSEQLRGFLRYICEAEFEGRAHELNEYALGVSVLGRPASYSPAEDSCVRSRAYELRNKLKSYYQSEAPDDPVQITIDKGAYVPRFERRTETLPAEDPPRAVESDAPVSIEPPSERSPHEPRRHPARLGVAALVAALVLTSASSYFYWQARGRASVQGIRAQFATPEMEALWKPFLDSSVPLIVSFEIRLFFYAPPTGLVVRDYLTNQASDLAKSKPLLEFQRRMGVEQMQERFDYADSGAVHASFLIGRLLNRDIGLKHSSALGWEDILNSNVIFIGKPNLNPTIRYTLQGEDFVGTEAGGDIRNLHPRPGEPEMYTGATTHGEGEKYALITVRPGPQPGRHMMILSGAGAELMWALAEAVTNPARVREIMRHVLLPSGEAPAAFQVVISATFESNVPIRIHYVTHRVSKAK